MSTESVGEPISKKLENLYFTLVDLILRSFT